MILGESEAEGDGEEGGGGGLLSESGNVTFCSTMFGGRLFFWGDRSPPFFPHA